MQRSLFGFVLASGLFAACSTNSTILPQALPPHGFQQSDCASASGEVGPVVPGRPIAQRQPSAPRFGPRQGFACILVTIDTKGNVTQRRVVSTNSEAFARNFLAALSRWRYAPVMVNGDAVEVRTLIFASYSVTPAS